MMTDNVANKARMLCREIMTTAIKTADRNMSIGEAAAMLRDSDVGALPVAESGKLIGIITDRDIVVRAIADGKGSETPVAEAMTTELFTVRPDDFAFEAIRLMGDKQVRRIPVTNAEGGLEGIIAMADIVLEIEDEREIAETLEEISSGSAFWGKNQ